MFDDRFFVGSTYIPGIGWQVEIAVVCEGDDCLNLKMEDQLAKMNIVMQQQRAKQVAKKGRDKQEEDQTTTEDRKPHTPYHRLRVADIIKPLMVYNPDMSYRDIKQAYGKEYVLTDSLVQDAKHAAKEDLFGTAEQNAKYANGVVSELVAMGLSETKS